MKFLPTSVYSMSLCQSQTRVLKSAQIAPYHTKLRLNDDFVVPKAGAEG